MNIRKYLLEMILFIGSLGHFILSILNDLNIFHAPNWLLSIPVAYIASVLFFVLLIYKESTGHDWELRIESGGCQIMNGKNLVNILLLVNIFLHPIFIGYSLLVNHPISQSYLLFTFLTTSSCLLIYFVLHKERKRD